MRMVVSQSSACCIHIFGRRICMTVTVQPTNNVALRLWLLYVCVCERRRTHTSFTKNLAGNRFTCPGIGIRYVAMCPMKFSWVFVCKRKYTTYNKYTRRFVLQQCCGHLCVTLGRQATEYVCMRNTKHLHECKSATVLCVNCRTNSICC